MTNSFMNLVSQYRALPKITSGRNIELSLRFEFLEKSIRKSSKDIEKGDLIALFLADISDIWKSEYYSSIMSILEIDRFNIYQTIGFLEFLSLKKDPNFSDCLSILFTNILNEMEDINYKNWFFIFEIVKSIDIYNQKTLKIKYYNQLISILIDSHGYISADEYRNSLFNNIDSLMILERYSSSDFERSFIKKWM